ncbi:MAG: integrin alpha, partial [Microcystaceae cyanobacterium]
MVVSQKIDRQEFEADTDLYSYKLPISSKLFTDDVTLDCSPVAPTTTSNPGSGTVEFPISFDVGVSSSKSQKSVFKFLPVFNNVDYEIRIRALQDQIGSKPQLQTNGEIRLSYAIPVNKINQAFALTLIGYAQGIANFENNKVTSGELHLEGELDGYISFFAGEPHKIEIPVLGEAEVDLGILVELALEFVQQWQLNNSSEQSNTDNFWLELVREDGSPAQPGDDPNQLHWTINLDEAAQNLFGPPSGSTTIAREINFTPALGLYGKATVKAAGLNIVELDAEALGSFELSYNFNDPGNPLSKSVTESFELDGTVFGITFHFTVSATENLSTTTTSEVGYNPIVGSETIYGDNPILGAAVSQDLTHDGPASLVMGADNTIYMTWVKDAPNGSSDFSYVLVAKSQDGGSTWSTPITIPNSAGLNLEPVIQVDGPGQVVVAWNHGAGSTLANIPPGKAYLIFGGANLSSQTSIDLTQLNGSNGFTLTGEMPFSQIGYSVSETGDVNDDGITDFLVGAPDSNIEQGQTYVVFGSKTGLGAGGTLNVSNLNGSNGFIVAGDPNGQGELGYSVSQAGDINNDGIADLVVGAPSEKAGAGVAYVVFGSKTIAPG